MSRSQARAGTAYSHGAKTIMTRHERLKRCYFHEETDRPAVYSRAGFPPNDDSYDDLRAYLQAHSELKVGWSPGWEGCSAGKIIEEKHSGEFQRRTETVRTPKGDLKRSWLVNLATEESIIETNLLKTAVDADFFLSLPSPKPQADLSGFLPAVKQMGDAGIVQAGLGFNPAGFVAELFGSETFAMMSATERDTLHALCEQRTKIMLGRLKYMLDGGIGPFFSMLGQEYIVPPLHGLDDFNDFNVRYDKPIINLIHDAGGRIHVHSHGSIKKVFQGFLDMGVDVLHPFEAPPMGDVTSTEAKSLARGKICIEGNIQINRMYEATPDEIRAETLALIETCFDDKKGLIVSPTASPYIHGRGELCFPQYKAMIDTVVGWKG